MFYFQSVKNMCAKQFIITLLILSSNYVFGEQVIRIIDGDTFELLSGKKVRMIGINAPEKSDIFGKDATEKLSKFILNKDIILTKDPMSNDTDRYGRLLRYVTLNSVDINKKMIEDGFAFAYLKYQFTKKNEYRNAQIKSQQSNKGIWKTPLKEINKKSVGDNTLPISKNLIILLIGIIALILVGLKVLITK